MAFVPEYESDIFVSYAHVDDQSLIEAAGAERSTGWVATLVRHLKTELAQKIGRAEAVSVWFDAHNLRGHHTLVDEIAARLQRSAIFLAILSPGYAASRWCQDEVSLFTSGSRDLARRIFMVEKAPLDEGSAVPPGISGLRAYRFWYRDRNEQPRTFAIPVPRIEEIDYFRQVEDLARDLRDQCRAMRGEPAAPQYTIVAPATTSVPSSTSLIKGPATVLLAEVTDDLEFKRNEVQRYLEQQDLRVLPQLSYPLGRAEFEAALTSDLTQSHLFVQLLGPVPGKRPRDIPEGYAWLQLEAARRAGLPLLQWRSPDLQLDDVEWPHHRELLELETVQATSLEGFKREILEALRPPSPPPAVSKDGSGRPLVFLNTEPRHRAIAAEIRSAIGDRAVWTEPLFEGPAEMVREDLEQNLIDCDAIVMVYADNPGWARAQLRNFHKVSQRREQPVWAISIIDAPPAEKPELGFYLPEMVLIDGRSGIGADALGKLSASLRL